MAARRSKIEVYLGWIVLTMLLIGSLIVLMPFLTALLWAGVLCFSTWPLYQRLLEILKHRRTLAAFIMSLAMILVILLPFLIVGATLADNVGELRTAVHRWIDEGPPSPPDWLPEVPVVGQSAYDYWLSLTADSAKLVATAKRFVEPVSGVLLKLGVILGRGLLQLGLSVFIAFFLYRDGIALAAMLKTAVIRIGGNGGDHLLRVAGNTVQGVVYGVLGTALVQSVMAGIGFVIAGVPGAAVLGLLTFFFSVVPIGPPLVWLPAALWLFSRGLTGWGISC
jgi:predicted PurR-regulated permease PerM